MASRSEASPRAPRRPIAARGDHRIAILGAVAGLVSREGVGVEGADAAHKLPRLLRPPRFSLQTMIVAIDGPAGAGKSTVARRLAERLGFRYLDTGAMYRALTWLALRRGLASATASRSASSRAEPGHLRRRRQRLHRRHRRDRSIRRSRIDRIVPVVARHPAVREVMRERQRELGHHGDVVIEGRDIGTVVAPDAEVKVYLVADPAVRARRRQAERPDIGARRARDRPQAARPERPRADATGRGRASRSTRPISRSTTSSTRIEELVRAPAASRPCDGTSRGASAAVHRRPSRACSRARACYGRERIPPRAASCSRSTTSPGSTSPSSARSRRATHQLRREGRRRTNVPFLGQLIRGTGRSPSAAASPTARRCG